MLHACPVKEFSPLRSSGKILEYPPIHSGFPLRARWRNYLTRSRSSPRQKPMVVMVLRSLVLVVCLVGCARVAPYQREALASPIMDVRREASAQTFRAHVHDSREGATGGHDSTGAGCGCN